MTTVARVGRSYMRPSTKAANEPKYPEPADPTIKTKTDMFYALAAWAVGPLVVIGAVSLAVYLTNR